MEKHSDPARAAAEQLVETWLSVEGYHDIKHANPDKGFMWAKTEAVAAIIRKHFAASSDDQPITDDWLRLNGWHKEGDWGRPGTLPTRTREIGRPSAPDDLCISVAARSEEDGMWYCWIRQVEPRRSIFVRMIRTVGDIKRLYEGLTGYPWRPGRAYGEPQKEQGNA